MPADRSAPEPPPTGPGLLAALTDTRFTVSATPLVVRWLYLGCAALIALMTALWVLLAVLVATWRNGWLWGVLGLFVAPVAGFVLLLAARIVCEFILARFRR